MGDQSNLPPGLFPPLRRHCPQLSSQTSRILVLDSQEIVPFPKELRVSLRDVSRLFEIQLHNVVVLADGHPVDRLRYVSHKSLCPTFGKAHFSI